MNKDNVIFIPISVGELLDRYSILQIKLKFISNKQKLQDINIEVETIIKDVQKYIIKEDCNRLYQELYEINEKIWIISDIIRESILNKIYDDSFISVHIFNDERYKKKMEINKLFNQTLNEHKSYNILLSNSIVKEV